MPQNIELKARVDDLRQLAQVAAGLGAHSHGVLHQIDTYFHADRGRLKLREINGERAELIWYARPDEATAKLSHYVISSTPEPLALRECLENAYGVETVVEKHRDLWLYQNVRIHLDQVVKLGQFLEFEAVLSETDTAEDGRRLVAMLREAFSIDDPALIQGSYRELMLGDST